MSAPLAAAGQQGLQDMLLAEEGKAMDSTWCFDCDVWLSQLLLVACLIYPQTRRFNTFAIGVKLLCHSDTNCTAQSIYRSDHCIPHIK